MFVHGEFGPETTVDTGPCAREIRCWARFRGGHERGEDEFWG